MFVFPARESHGLLLRPIDSLTHQACSMQYCLKPGETHVDKSIFNIFANLHTQQCCLRGTMFLLVIENIAEKRLSFLKKCFRRKLNYGFRSGSFPPADDQEGSSPNQLIQSDL